MTLRRLRFLAVSKPCVPGRLCISVIPVTADDFESRRKYASTNEMQTFRDIERLNYNYSKEAHTTKLDHDTAIQVEQDMQRAYRLAKQDEIVREINKRFNSEFYQLAN